MKVNVLFLHYKETNLFSVLDQVMLSNFGLTGF